MTKKGITVLFILLAFLSGCYPSKEIKRIGVLNWSEGLKGYRQAYNGIVEGLRDNGYREGLNLEIDYRTAESSDDKAREIVKDFIKNDYDLIVTVGSAACITALKGTVESKTPVVFSVVTHPKAAGIIDDWNSSGNNLTGVSIDIQAEPYLGKLKKILPTAKDIGILYMDMYRTAVASARQAEAAAPAFGLKPQMIRITKEDIENIDRFVSELSAKPDAIYIVGDPVLYAEKNMNLINSALKRAGIPAILISENYLKYGALFSLNGDFYKIGRQTVPHILKIFDGVRPENIPNEKPYNVRFTVNKKTADDLGIDLKWNIIIEANSIME